jgi:fructokinase
LGLDAAFLTAVGDDALGRDALESMRSLGVPTDLVQIVRDAPTGTAAVELDDDGRPRFEIGSPAAYEQIRCDAAALEGVAALTPAAIVFGTLAQRFAPVRAATRAILAAHPDAMRVYDVNLRDGCWSAPLVKELLAEATILKLSDAEIPVLARMLDLPSQTPGSFGRALGRLCDLEVVCVTEGASGSTTWTRDGVVSISGISVDVVDTIGAGDAFTAAFVATLLKGEPAGEALRLANALGALVASREGAIPPWNLSELVAFAADRAEAPIPEADLPS